MIMCLTFYAFCRHIVKHTMESITNQLFLHQKSVDMENSVIDLGADLPMEEMVNISQGNSINALKLD